MEEAEVRGKVKTIGIIGYALTWKENFACCKLVCTLFIERSCNTKSSRN